ncbi:MAG TPA: DNA-formamidopyrimidine glycosylase family protein [Methylomirabilota bacterium]|nr:DNA-formamidopyrimidine glycosylase family protein [Methylomirabilota bacterium]
MPELAEVEFYRTQWNDGLGKKVLRVALHGDKRIFRGTDVEGLERVLAGSVLKSSEARGKQMLFRFTKDAWLGLHLGMTGKLTTAPADHAPAKHEHLVLFQKERALVFEDMRQFGRVHFHQGKEAPAWWAEIGVAPNDPEFTLELMRAFLARRPKLTVKAVLLVQEGFPGIGNWMADEILWRAGIQPARLVRDLSEEASARLWKETRYVAREALKKIGKKFGDPPKGWLFHERWSRKGVCPKHDTPLERATIGGRTTAWCARCQPS